MKNDVLKNVIICIFSIATVFLLLVNAYTDLNGFWSVNISDGIEIFILIFVSYFLVERQDNKNRKKERIFEVIVKIQEKLLEPELIRVSTEDEKKITRIKFTAIMNYIEIIKGDVSDTKTMDIIVSEMDNLSAIVMDHIDDEDYIKKSNAQILRVLTSIDTKLEKIIFELN